MHLQSIDFSSYGSFENCFCYFRGGGHRGSRKDKELYFLSTRLVLHCCIVTNCHKLSSLKSPGFTTVKPGTQRLKGLCFGSHKAEIKILVTLGFYQEAVEKTHSDSQVFGRIQSYVVAGLRSQLPCWLFAGVILIFERLTGFLPKSPHYLFCFISSLTPVGKLSLL